MKSKAVFNWSGGKDSALALYKAIESKEFEIISLLTTVNRDHQRSTIHAIPVSLLQEQAKSIGIPLYIVELDSASGMEQYGVAMEKAVAHFKNQEVTHFIFGDIFLHNVKSYREKQLTPQGINVVEPLWGKSSEEIIAEFLQSGLKTVIVTTMADILDKTFIVRHIDDSFINDYPVNADICGEHGEYHTFCYAGGMFQHPVVYTLGEPEKKSYTFKMDDGMEKEFSYWFANLQE